MQSQLQSVLLRSGAVASDAMVAAVKDAESRNLPLLDVVLQELHVTEETVAQSFASQLRIPFVHLAATTLEPEATKLLSEEMARRAQVIPIRREAGDGKRRDTLTLAMSNPTDLNTIQDVEFSTGCAVKPVVSTRTEIIDAIGHYYSPESWLNDFLQNVTEDTDLSALKLLGGEEPETPGAEIAQAAPAVKMANLVIQHGIKRAASDIHIEPGLNEVMIRMREQGMLREFTQFPKWLQEPLLSRLKILAKLDITERRVPQDGRIKVSFDGRQVDLRVSTLPTHFGEKIVMRILGSGQKVPATKSLGLAAADLHVLKKASEQPQGLVLVTGPTGSGKTTTLYSLLNERKSPEINIITVEDPIEFQLEGITQVQVNTKTGLTFAAALRSILRQDPDVVLVGEIRDLETAEIAFHAAMTGHLVFSTLHTNSTCATVARLLDLGVDPFLIGSSTNLILAQRLLRTNCRQCAQPYTPPRDQLERLHLENAKFDFVHGVGCEACGKSGYAGRAGVYELLRITPTLKELISRKAGEPEIRKAAVNSGMVLLLDAAIQKIKDGHTTVEEVLRVIQLQEEEVARCPKCGSLIDLQFANCPYCMHSLKTVCEGCRQQLKPEWKMCPYCSTAVSRKTAPATPEPVRVSAAAAAVATEALPTVAVGRQPYIMVVDDDDVMRSVIADSIAMLPLKPEVAQFSNGFEALAGIERKKPDMLILDLNMPGMTGFDVCEKLRKNMETAFIPILMLTASVDEANRTRGFMVGTDDYMGKPFAVPELHARATRLLRRTYGF